MKKLFLFISIFAFAMMANATTWSIGPNDPQSSDNIRRTVRDKAQNGDIIVLADGTYTEAEVITFDKSVTVMAAEGAHPVIAQHYYSKVTNGADVKFIGIKFDGSIYPASDHCFYPYDNTAGNELHFENCEFTGFASYVLYNNGSYSLDSLIVNNCYFHNNTKSCVIFFKNHETAGSQSVKGAHITNSTFANNLTADYSVVYIMNQTQSAVSDIEILLDHCTFYNNPVTNTDHSSLRSYKSTNVTVSNCIFAHPEAVDARVTCLYGGAVSNCLTYNLTHDASQNGHRQSGGQPVLTNNFTADPLFTDAANGDYSFAGNWVTMNLSPARGAATDGSDLGDPRWYSAEVLPNVDFASPYQFIGTKALLAGQIGLNANDNIEYYDTEDKGTATWKIHATRACVLNATLNMETGSSSGHIFKVEVLDADGNTVGELAEPSQSSHDGNIDLPGTLSIPAEGDYTVILYNLTAWSSAKLEGVTFTYVGGEVQNMPGTTNIADAWFSSEGTRADGKIDFPDGYIQDGWVKWNVSFASAANYNVTVNIDNANGHNYTVALYRSESDESPITVSEGGQKGTIGTLELGAMEVPAGNYIMKVTNATQYSDAKLISVNFAYAGGAAVDLSKTTPAALLPNADAILSDDWTIEDGKISYTESKATTGYAKWNVNCADYGNYNVAVNISSDNGHGMRVEVFEDEAQPAIYTLDEASSGKYHTGDLALDLGNVLLADREYVVKITNTVSSSHAKIASIVITYQNGAQATLPATFNFEDGMLSEKAHITDGNLWFNTIGDSNPVGQWAKWNVKVTNAGTFLFTMNISSTNGQNYKISILDGETVIDAFESGSIGSGDKTVKHYFNLAAGNYTVKLENIYAWSQGHIVSLIVTEPSLLVLDEAAVTNAVISDNYRIDAQDIQITRTVLGGMYNAICLPFDVETASLLSIFGSDVKLYELGGATINGIVLDLQFNEATSIYRGTPYLIKTSRNIVNPVFENVIIKEKVGQQTSGTDADFIGTFVSMNVAADGQNMLLYANDRIGFPSAAKTLNGFRAYFQLHTSSGAPVREARIITPNNVPTVINLVEDTNNGTFKTIENGQLIIIRDGVQYNVMGARVK